MSHNLYAIVVRTEDVKPVDIKCFVKCKDDKFCMIAPAVALKHKVSLDMRRVQLMTDYFGGSGTQEASYFNEVGMITHFPDRTRDGAINSALSMLGVVEEDGKDNFDTIGLGKYRDDRDLLLDFDDDQQYEQQEDQYMVNIAVNDYNEILGGLEDMANWGEICKNGREKGFIMGEPECKEMSEMARRLLKLARKGVLA